MKKSLLSVNAASSTIKRLDARVKLMGLFCVSILVVLIDAPITLGAFLCLALLLHIFAGTEARKLKILFIILTVALWGTTISQAIFYAGYPRTAILTIIPADASTVCRWVGGIYLYREGFLHGMVQGLRFLVMTTLGMLVVWTTEPQEMLAGMLHMRIPYGQAFMLVTAFRFIPILFEEVNAILLAARIKGFKSLKNGVTHPVRTALVILNPLLANLVRKSGFLSLSVECRGFSPSSSRRLHQGKGLHPVEMAMVFAMALAISSVIFIKVLYLLYFNGLYYASSLRPFYSLARNYF
ncbi:energy-coupling factor transporter transmembrane component T family protein [Desulfobacca acetoxidans]